MRLLTLTLIAMVSLCPQNLWAGNMNAQNADIEDVIAKWHFIWIGDLYTDGQNKLLCVETDKHEYALWNPVSDTVSGSYNEQCKSAGSLHRLLLPSSNDRIAISETYIGAPANGCSNVFPYYYTFTYPTGTQKSFYLIRRLKTPDNFSFWCGPDALPKTLSMEFEDLKSDGKDLGDNIVLLHSYDKEVGPILIKLPTTMSDSIFSSPDKSIFIVPKSILDPFLNQAGNDLDKQYEALLAVIKEYL